MKKQYNNAEFVQRYIEVSRELGGGTVVVSGGGALLMLGLRTSTADLDLDVDEAVFEKHRTPNNTMQYDDTEIVNYSDDTSLHVLSPLQETQVIDGVRIYTVDDLISQKKILIDNPARGPEKIAQDRSDLRALQALRSHLDLLPDFSKATILHPCGYENEELREIFNEYHLKAHRLSAPPWPPRFPIVPWTSRPVVNFSWQLHNLAKEP